MTVLVLENASSGFRGELNQWMLEIKAGVFVGNISAAVRERVWKKVQNEADLGAGLIVYSAATEQGFKMDMCRTPERNVIDMEGIYLIKRKIEE